MVHSTFAQGHVMGGRDTSPLGIPKSPSFHSGLDLVASASVDSLIAAQTTTPTKHIDCETAGHFLFDYNNPGDSLEKTKKKDDFCRNEFVRFIDQALNGGNNGVVLQENRNLKRLEGD